MPLELGSLKKSLAALGRVLAKSSDAGFMRGLDDDAREVVKAGVIQHFKIAYELSWKFIRRWLNTNINPTVADGVTRPQLFRLAAENRLIDDMEQWMRHHKARNQTSHIYETAIAEEVYAAVPGFACDARKLLEAMEARND